MFAMCRRWLPPGWDWLVARKLSSLWREIIDTLLEADMVRFVEVAESAGFTAVQSKRAASQSVGRLLIQNGRPLSESNRSRCLPHQTQGDSVSGAVAGGT